MNDNIDIIEASKSYELKLWMNNSIFHYIDIVCDKCLLSIENRQYYCDRGRFSVKAFSHDNRVFHIDDSDMFPRYFFIFDNLISEMHEWTKYREVRIVSIDKKFINPQGEQVNYGNHNNR